MWKDLADLITVMVEKYGGDAPRYGELPEEYLPKIKQNLEYLERIIEEYRAGREDIWFE